MKAAPLVSVLIPLYNKAHTIRQTINSAIQQTYKNIEIIVVDDGSTDTGKEVVKSIVDSRVRMYTQCNFGQSAARNRGIQEARGSLVAFLDADDFWDDGHLASLVNLVARFPDVGVVATAYRAIYSKGYTRDVRVPAKRDAEWPMDSAEYFKLASIAPFIWVSAVGVPRDVFDEFGLFLVGEDRGADREMWARVALRRPVAYDSRVSATYNCAAVGRESNKKRKIQAPPLLRLLDSEIEGLGSGIDQYPLLAYRNSVLFGYLGKLLSGGSRQEMGATLRKIHPLGSRDFLRLIGWKLLVCLPAQVARIVLRMMGSRYIWWLKGRPKNGSVN